VAGAGHAALAGFADELTRLRVLCGSPSLNDLVAAAAGHPHRLARSTISDKLAAKSLPDWDFVASFVTACATHASRAGIVVDRERTDLARWDEAHWRMLAAIDDARADDRLAGAALAELAHHERRHRPGAAGRGTPSTAGVAVAPTAGPAAAPTERPDGPTAVSAGRPDRSVPRQLPAAMAHFAGRATQLAALTELVRHDPDTTVIAAISGTAGVGKTTLAVHWAHRVAGHFPDGQLYVNLRGFDPDGSAVTPAGAVRRFLVALGVAPDRVPVGPDEQAALYRSELAGRRMLVVLDNARDADHVRLLLPGSPGCLVLVTSRNQLSSLVTVEGAHPVTVDLPSPAEAREMLARRLGERRVAAEPQAVDQIVTRCARLPLALAVVAARAAAGPGFPLDALADQLDATLDGLVGGDVVSDVRAVFSWSYDALGPDAARLFRLLGLHPGPDVSTAAAAALAGLPHATARSLLAELAAGHLVMEHAPGRYTFHDLLRSYAVERAGEHEPEPERLAATRRVLDHYLHTAHAAAMLLDPHREPIEPAVPHPGTSPQPLTDYPRALRWFTAEHQVLLAAVRHADAVGLDTLTWQLAWTLVDFLDRRGHWHDHIASGEVAVGAARRTGDPAVLARAHRLLARGHTRLRRFEDSDTHLRHALELHRAAGDPIGQAHTHLNLAFAREQQDRHADALHHAGEALVLYQGAGHEPGQASALSALATYHALCGDHPQALRHGEQALALHQKLDYAYGQAAAWDSLGHAHHHLGHHARAIDCYRHTLDLVRGLGDRFDEAGTLVHIGDLHHAAGDPAQADAAWRQALAILDELDHPQAAHVRARLTAPAVTGAADGGRSG
jgi:tetratricopeptide (TPR) repeat protein